MSRVLLFSTLVVACIGLTKGQPNLGPGAYLNVTTSDYLLNVTLFTDATGPALSGTTYCDLLDVPGNPYYIQEVYASPGTSQTTTSAPIYGGNEDPDGESGQNALLSPLFVLVEVGASVELVLHGTDIAYDPGVVTPAKPDVVNAFNTSGAANSTVNTGGQAPIAGFSVDVGAASGGGPHLYSIAPFYSATFAPAQPGALGYVYGKLGSACAWNFTFVSYAADTLTDGL